MSKYNVETTDYGLHLVFNGFVSPDEVTQMNTEIERAVTGLQEGFGVLVDMRANRAFSNEVAELLKTQVGIVKERGMSRAAVVLQSAIMTLQARRITTETEATLIIRFIDSSANSNWEKTAIDWITKGTEPPVRMMGGAL